MPSSSKPKSSKHSSRDAREYSDSEQDSGFKDRNNSSAADKRKLDSRDGKDVHGSSGTGNYSEEYASSSKRRKDGGGGGDRWYGGDDDHGEGSRKSKVASSESESRRRDGSVGVFGEGEEAKRIGDKSDGKHGDSSSSGRRESRGEAWLEKEKKFRDGRSDYSVEYEEQRVLKHAFENNGDAQSLEDESTKIFARKVADHYSARSNQTLEEREASPIIHLKKLNNWIKSVIIQLYARRGDAVLDLACGKGGDLIKWDKAKIGYYVGIDIAEGSIKDCRTRYNGDADHHQRRKKFTFPARLMCGDCYEVRLDKVLADDAPFDICSCQFALHYSWSTEARARRALANVSALLRPGGIFIGTMPDANVIIKKLREAEGLAFGNSVYWVRFDEEFADKKFKSSSPFGIKYKFHLEDAVDCPEWIVPFHVFKSLAEEYDFELVLAKNSHEFVHEYMKKPEFVELMRRLGALGDGNQDQSTLSADEWEAAYLYMAFVLRKRGQPDKTQASSRRDQGLMHITEQDIMYISSD